MQLPIRLRDTKDAAESSRRQRSYLLEFGRWEMKHGRRVKLLENKRHYRQEKAGDVVRWVVLKTQGVDIENSKLKPINHQKHAMVDVS
ncbi:hypothetical protein HID58_062818 [Brassica napus]|uniref:BnaC04g43730D protein n=2 Tax=Brassica napus TaxID=3708 RepID=A0A078GEI4_BRANA|nr:hypothetical protein HID58_062818 [Brassica napus]CAF1866539.1 unnamed protein product [Brassica napus]CDY23749.1 BnaC04g43730D [Brassica napus]